MGDGRRGRVAGVVQAERYAGTPPRVKWDVARGNLTLGPEAAHHRVGHDAVIEAEGTARPAVHYRALAAAYVAGKTGTRQQRSAGAACSRVQRRLPEW